MTGAIAGDIIASPYRSNPLPDSGSIFFPLFSSSTRVDLDRTGRRAASRTFRAQPTLLTAASLSAARWMMRPDQDGTTWRDETASLPGGGHLPGEALLAACATVGSLSGEMNGAIGLSSTLLRASGADDTLAEDATALIRLLFAVREHPDPESLKGILREAGYDPDRNPSEMRPFLLGTVVQTGPGKLGIGDGKPSKDPSQVIPAALSALLASGSYEETVRRAVAMAGDPCITAFLAGALAERRFGVPDPIASEALDFLSAEERMTVRSAERMARHSEEEDVPEVPALREEGKRFEVIRMEGAPSVYVVPEGNDDIEAVLRTLSRKSGTPYRLIRPGERTAVLENLSRQETLLGELLDGTYAEHPRPEVKTLWLQEGSVRTSTTRSGRALPSPEKRIAAFNEFRKLRDYAEEVRCELERLSGADPPDELHIHFASAFYPVVLERRIDLMQGDILRGRVGIGDDGRIRVDTSAMTGGFHGEGLEGVLATMDLFRKNDSPADIKAALDRWCLDRGAIEDEEERRALKEGGDEAESVRRKYRSNIDTAVSDLCAIPGDLRVAAVPAIPKEMAAAAHRREERTAESRERYAGLSHEDVVWSKTHPGSVFTIGHSNLPAEEFEGLLRRFGIQLVVDIRSYPRSRYSPQFNAETLGPRLEEGLGIGYQRAGDAFGGHLYEGTGDSRRRLSYEETMARPEFSRYLRALRECVREGTRVALMCSESDPSDCHRFAMVGYALAHPRDGRIKPVDVQHITRSGYLLSQEYLENRLIRSLGLSDRADALATAMRKKGEALVARSRDTIAISLRRNAKESRSDRPSGPKHRR